MKPRVYQDKRFLCWHIRAIGLQPTLDEDFCYDTQPEAFAAAHQYVVDRRTRCALRLLKAVGR